MIERRLLVACGMNVGWTLAGQGLDTGWMHSGQVTVGQSTSSPSPVHVTACWTFNGPYCSYRAVHNTDVQSIESVGRDSVQ